MDLRRLCSELAAVEAVGGSAYVSEVLRPRAQTLQMQIQEAATLLSSENQTDQSVSQIIKDMLPQRIEQMRTLAQTFVSTQLQIEDLVEQLNIDSAGRVHPKEFRDIGLILRSISDTFEEAEFLLNSFQEKSQNIASRTQEAYDVFDEANSEIDNDELDKLIDTVRKPYYTVDENQARAVKEDLDRTEDLSHHSQIKIKEFMMEECNLSKTTMEILKSNPKPEVQKQRLQENSPVNTSISDEDAKLTADLESWYSTLPDFLTRSVSMTQYMTVLEEAKLDRKCYVSGDFQISAEWLSKNFPKIVKQLSLILNQDPAFKKVILSNGTYTYVSLDL